MIHHASPYTRGFGGMKSKLIKGHIHVSVVDNNLIMIHTKDEIKQGNLLQIGERQVLVRHMKSEDSKYFPGYRFYEINFKDSKR